MTDIAEREDIDRLLIAFYEIAMADGMIGHHFVSLDLKAHLPIIGDFWEKVLFGRPVYFNDPLLIHRQLHKIAPLEPEHFDRWVMIFTGVVDRLFAGDTADMAKSRAAAIGNTLSQRLNGGTMIEGLKRTRA